MPEYQSIPHLLPLHYEGHQIRTHVDDHCQIWWVAKDVCDELDIRVTDITKRLDDDEVDSIYLVDTLGRSHAMLCVNEPGLYTLILGSRKPAAKAFKRWVTHDVLPTLRRTGTYTISQISDQLTHQGQLPAPAPRIKEHAEVSWHLAAVWSLLHRTGECLTNHEIAQRTGIAPRTARAHTRYLLQVGMLELYETFPRHLYVLSPHAAKKNAGIYQRLHYLTEVIQARHHF
jgi:prophage antirepressor-like protein